MINSTHGLPADALRSKRRSGFPPAGLVGLGASALLLLNGCASTSTSPAEQAQYDNNNDPAEPTNRAIFAGNQFVDRNALQPVARSYKANVPEGAQRGIHNFMSNLEQPSIAINDAMQGNFSRAWTSTERFAVNTTAGGVGLFDVASEWNLPGHHADFGQTLGVWGVATGPAVQLPLFGASNVRDSVGKVVGMVTNPVQLIPIGVAAGLVKSGVSVVDGRADVLDTTDSLDHTSLDYYATLRSLSAQHRAAMVTEGEFGAPAPNPPNGINKVSVTISAPAP